MKGEEEEDNDGVFRHGELPIGLGSALDMFQEKEEVMGLINSLPEIFLNPEKVERAYETYQKIIDRYQEQPHLLDNNLEPMIHACLQIFRTSDTPPTLPLRHLSLKFLRQVFKVRGPKEVVKRMPHEVSDLVPVLTFAETLDLESGKTWESGYVLIMWLSILVINPFHLKLLDGSSDGDSIAQRIQKLCMKAVIVNNNVGQCTPTLISNFMTRPDMQELYMKSFINWACSNLKFEVGQVGVRMGAFGSLAALFKHGKREEILMYGKKVLKAVMESDYALSDTLIRKLGTKLIQRIGMMFMKTKLAPWRYQRGSRSLLTNLKASADTGFTGLTPKPENIVDTNLYEELDEFSPEIESVLDLLLGLLKDKDTIVRWSAAKGIGRVTNRLPKEYGDEVVQSILEGFTERESHGTWHGGCLALAELGRRGLLLPETLPSTIPVIQKALVFDEIRGNFSVGGHVRDAACYVLWAFARAFEPNIVEPYVTQISSALVVTMLFDREINCRRAAAAAFQENVGRQGNFPHGIDIVTIADYFTLGIKTDAFTKVSIEVAQFPEYIHPMVDHLIALKCNHYDLLVRELTSQALAKLAKLDPDYVRTMVMEKVLPVATDQHVQTAQGAVLTIANTIVALTEIGKFDISPNNFRDIRNIAKTLLENQFRKTVYGYIPLREAACHFIMCCSKAKFPVHDDDEILEVWHSILKEGIGYCAPTLREKAAAAFPVFLTEYYYMRPDRHEDIKGFLTTFCTHLKSNALDARLGYSLGLGKFPPYILKSAFPQVMAGLTECALVMAQTDQEFAESRREALRAIGSILSHGIIPVETVQDWSTGIPVGAIDCGNLFSCFISGLDDYTTDKRGDIGSWVRMAAMTALKEFIISLHKCEVAGNMRGTLLSAKRLTKVIGLIAKQCVEKIDNVRVHAAEVFAALLKFDDPPILETLPHHSQITEIFPQKYLDTANWRDSSDNFPRFAELMKIEGLTYEVLSGFVLSGGSLSDSVLKDANTAISNYLLTAAEDGSTEELTRIGKTFLEIFKNYHKVERVTLPLMKFLTQLLQSNIFQPILMDGNEEFGIQLADCVKDELSRSNRVEKLAAGVELLCELMQASSTLTKLVLRRLVVYLCHAYPRVRNHTAEKLYEALNTYGDMLGEDAQVEAAMAILSETQWISSIETAQLRPTRNRLCQYLNIPIPTLLPKEGAK